MILFLVIFSAAGFAGFWFITLRPFLLSEASAHWVETPCEILSSELQRHSSSDGDTYRVLIRYRYTWQGRELESQRYDFTAGASNIGVERMHAAIAAHPPGHRTVCYVDPAEPESAVLARGTPGSAWFGLLALIFPLVGGLMFVHSRRSARLAEAGARSPLGAAGLRPAGDASAPAPDARTVPPAGEVVLRPATGRVSAFVGFTIFALIWNGVTWFMVVQMLRDFRGGLGWFLVLFFVPFLLIGLFVAGLAFQAFSRLFAPPVEVRLEPSRLRLGARVPFTWRLGGRGVRRLRVRLIGREEATYRQGTRTATDKSEFHRELLVESTDPLGLAEGRGELVLPSEAAAPALAEKNNRLVWELVFDGEIPWRADVDDRFPLPVRGPEAPPALATTPEPREHRSGGLTLWSVEHFAPGETLVFTLARDPGAITRADSFTVQLGWFTEGKGTRDAAIAWREALPALTPGASHDFEIKLPEAPWSFAGKLVAVEWRLEVLDGDRVPVLSVPLVIAPGGVAVRLPALEPEPSSFAARKARYLARRGR
jgi:hypothetical protein